MKLKKELFLESRNDFHGYCRNCDDITEYGGVEPDAVGYRCPACDKGQLMGVEHAFMIGAIQVVLES